MDIKGITSMSESPDSGKIKKAQAKRDESLTSVKTGNDEVSISSEALSASKGINLINKMKDLPEIRTELVDKAKADLENGTLFSRKNIEETAEKLLKGLSNNEI